jgi:hypothetical protein
MRGSGREPFSFLLDLSSRRITLPATLPKIGR